MRIALWVNHLLTEGVFLRAPLRKTQLNPSQSHGLYWIPPTEKCGVDLCGMNKGHHHLFHSVFRFPCAVSGCLPCFDSLRMGRS